MVKNEKERATRFNAQLRKISRETTSALTQDEVPPVEPVVSIADLDGRQKFVKRFKLVANEVAYREYVHPTFPLYVFYDSLNACYRLQHIELDQLDDFQTKISAYQQLLTQLRGSIQFSEGRVDVMTADEYAKRSSWNPSETQKHTELLSQADEGLRTTGDDGDYEQRGEQVSRERIHAAIEDSAEQLGLPPELIAIAKQLIDDAAAENHSILWNESPTTLASGAVYLAGKLNGLQQKYTQEKIADHGGPTVATLRKKYQLLDSHLPADSDDRYRVDALRKPIPAPPDVPGLTEPVSKKVQQLDIGYDTVLPDFVRDDLIAGTNIAFIGQMEVFTQSQLDVLIIELGGTTHTRIKPHTTHLVVGTDPPEHVLDTAAKHDVTVVEEPTFYRYLVDEADPDAW